MANTTVQVPATVAVAAVPLPVPRAIKSHAFVLVSGGGGGIVLPINSST